MDEELQKKSENNPESDAALQESMKTIKSMNERQKKQQQEEQRQKIHPLIKVLLIVAALVISFVFRDINFIEEGGKWMRKILSWPLEQNQEEEEILYTMPPEVTPLPEDDGAEEQQSETPTESAE